MIKFTFPNLFPNCLVVFLLLFRKILGIAAKTCIYHFIKVAIPYGLTPK